MQPVLHGKNEKLESSGRNCENLVGTLQLLDFSNYNWAYWQLTTDVTQSRHHMFKKVTAGNEWETFWAHAYKSAFFSGELRA